MPDLPADLSESIRSLIARYKERADDQRLLHLAEAHDGLPVYSDMGGDLLLLPDGNVIVFGNDDKEGEPVSDSWATIAYLSAAKRFPELKSMVPKRPDNAEDCQACMGDGQVVVGSLEILCGKCSGLGWIVEAT